MNDPSTAASVLKEASGRPDWLTLITALETARRFSARGPAASPPHWKFVRTGDPNGGALPLWRRFDAAERAFMRFDAATAPATEPVPARVLALFEMAFTR